MDIDLQQQPRYTLVRLSGVLDESCKPAFDEHLHPLVERGVSRLLIDLAGCARATSAGLGHLVTLVSRANAKGGQVVFIHPSPFLRTVLRATKLTKFFDMAESVEDAEQQFSQESG